MESFLSNAAPARLGPETGTDSDYLSQAILEQILQACLVEGLDREMATHALFDLLEDLKPRSILESMLAGQLAASHFLGMKQLASAAKSEHLNVQQTHLQLGSKLQRTFLAQIDALMKLRGHSKPAYWF